MLKIKGRINRGKIDIINRSMSMDDIFPSTMSNLQGLKIVQLLDEPCLHCGEKLFGLAPDKGEYLEFCMTNECLQADSNASKPSNQ